MKQQGFSLVELMVTLTLGLIITGTVIQVLVSNQVTGQFNQAVAQVQESGRFITARLQQELLEVGMYDSLQDNIDNSVDRVAEAAWVHSRPIIVPGDLVGDVGLGSAQGGNGGNDQLVVSLLASADCTGGRHGYDVDAQFHVINHFFIENNTLKCRGYDGRALRSLRVDPAPSTAEILLDNVQSFQVQYGVSGVLGSDSAQPIRYVTANALDGIYANNQQVVAIRFALLLRSDQGLMIQDQAPRFALLNEAAQSYNTDRYFQVFTQTFVLRNVKNYVRSI